MKNAQPTSFGDKGIKGRTIRFHNPSPPNLSLSHTHSFKHPYNHARSQNKQHSMHTHSQKIKKRGGKTATWTRYSTSFHKVSEPANRKLSFRPVVLWVPLGLVGSTSTLSVTDSVQTEPNGSVRVHLVLFVPCQS